MDTEKSAKNDLKAKAAKSPIDAYNEDYLAAYDRLDKAVVTLNADFTQAVAVSKETLSASQAEIDKFHKKNAADIVAVDKALAAEKTAVEKEIATVKETFAKETADNEAAKNEAFAASEKRVAKAAAAEKKAKETAEKNKNEKASAAAKANESIKNKAVLALDAEKKRNAEVVKNRAAKNKSIDDAYAKTVNELKAQFDKDVASLNNDIAAAQNKYLDTVKSKTQAYDKVCGDKKAAFDIKMKAFTDKSQSSDKLVMKEGLKGLKVTQKEFDGDAKTSKSAFDADLAALKAQFVASVPPVEHSIFLRTNKYKIDCLAAENSHIKTVENSNYEEMIEKETHAFNMETCGANNDINLSEQTHIEFCDECDNKSEIAVADFATETFNAEEEFKKAESNFNDALAGKRAEIKRNKAVQDNMHRQNLAVIENKYAKLGSEADTRYKQLTGELKALFASFDGFYNTLNKFNGTGVAVLSSVAESLESACGDLAMPAEKAYALFDNVVNIYNRDCGTQGTGVLDDKLAKLSACEKEALQFAQKRYDHEKATLKTSYDEQITLENADHTAKIGAFDREMSDFENKIAADIAAAKSQMDKTVADINAKIADFKNSDKNARAASENEKKEFVKKTNARLQKLDGDKKAREAAKLAEIKNNAAVLDAKLEALKSAINGEKKGENVMHAKLTEKTIKVLLKNCEIKPGSKWWIVDFSK